MSGYDYGNSRLRARRAGLLRGDQYAALTGRDLPALITALAATAYRPQAEVADADLESLHRIVRDHMTLALAGIRGFYRGRAGDVVTALLGGFDVHAVLSVLRARHHGISADTACALLIPAGAVSEETARRAAREPDLAAAARFFTTRRLPDPDTATALRHAQHRYEIDGDLAAVEETVTRSARDRQSAVLSAAGAEARQVAAAIRHEADDLNLLLALRLREAGDRRAASAGPAAYLPGGSLPLVVLRAIQRAPSSQDAVAAVPGQAWRGPLAGWSRELDRRGIFPPIDVLPSLSRLMNAGIGAGSTRDHHRELADQLYACYARGRSVRDLASIIGTAALGENDRRYLSFADDFEQRFIGQGDRRRGVEETLDRAWELLGRFPRHELTRIRQRHLDRHHSPAAETPAGQPDAPHPG